MPRLTWFAAAVLLYPSLALANEAASECPAPVSWDAGPGVGARECNPYTEEWLWANHGMYDNRWTALYEQWLQGDAQALRELRGDTGNAPDLGPDVRMSNAAFNSSQNEFQIVVNPINELFAIGSSNDNLTAGVGFYRTSDGGATWAAQDAPIGQAACCDPGIAYRYDGVAFGFVMDTSPQTGYVLRSSDNGVTWAGPFTANAGYDRGNITVDNGCTSPYRGTVYITYTNFSAGPGRIYFVRSTDAGQTWTAPSPVGDVPPGTGYQQSSDPHVASDGTIYVGYQEYENSGIGCSAPVRNELAKSTNGGATWTQTIITGAAIVQGGACISSQSGRGIFCINAGGSSFRSRSHPIMSGHPTDPLKVYVVYSGGDLDSAYSCGGGTGFHADTLFVKSTDGGATWSPKMKINTDPQGKDQYYPWIDTARNGTITVGWHDRRNDANNFTHQWYQAVSTNEGATWTETLVADVTSQPATFIGDYAGIGTTNTRSLGMWWDSRVKSGGDPFTDPTAIAVCPAIYPNPWNLPNGSVGSAYSQTFTSTGGVAPHTYAVVSGALPTGLGLNGTTGVLSGTPTANGNYSFNIQTTATGGCTGFWCYQILIGGACGTITVNPATLPGGTRGTAYSQTVSATGGTAPYTFSVSGGTLPSGLNLNATTGVISGTPTTVGTFNFTILATDAVGCQGTRAYAVTIACNTLTVNPATLPGGTSGVAYSQTITATGGTAPYTFAVTAGTLPPGLNLNATTGVLNGTPTASGTFNFTITGTDASGCQGTRAYSVTIACGVLTVSPLTLPAGTFGTAYSQTITATGGTAPYTFSVSSGALPTGLTLATATGVLSGTPTASGSFNFTITATDAGGCTGNRAYALSIACGTLTLSPATLPAGTAGSAYSQTVSASGGTAPYTFGVTAGALPPGLALASATGVLAGTPTTPGAFNFTITATDASGCTGSQAYTVNIACGGITLAPPTLPGGDVVVAYSQTVTASGGTAPYTFAVSSGTLPTGLALSPGGVLSGTPTAPGTFTFDVEATDANACVGRRAYAISIGILVDFIVGEGLGDSSGNGVRVHAGLTGVATAVSFQAYGAAKWGTNVASGDVDGGTYAEILTGPGPGDVYGPHVRGFDRTGAGMGKISFYAYGTLKYGANVAAGDVDGDGFDEIETGPGPGEVFGPHVRGWNFDGATLASIPKVSYFAYGTLKYGVNPSEAGLDADGPREILTGPGPGVIFGPQVRGWNYDNVAVTSLATVNFMAYSTLQYGVNLSGGSVDGDAFSEIATAPGPGAGAAFPSRFLGFNYDGATITPLPSFDVNPFPATTYGGRVGLGDVSNDDREDLLVGAGRDPNANSTTKAYDYTGAALVQLPPTFLPFASRYGVNVAGGSLGY